MLIALLLFTVICTVTENVFGLSVKNFGPINIYTLFWCQMAPYIIKVKENCNSPGMFTHDSYCIAFTCDSIFIKVYFSFYPLTLFGCNYSNDCKNLVKQKYGFL